MHKSRYAKLIHDILYFGVYVQALFAPMVVDAVSFLDPQLLDINLVRTHYSQCSALRENSLLLVVPCTMNDRHKDSHWYPLVAPKSSSHGRLPSSNSLDVESRCSLCLLLTGGCEEGAGWVCHGLVPGAGRGVQEDLQLRRVRADDQEVREPQDPAAQRRARAQGATLFQAYLASYLVRVVWGGL